MKFDLLIQWGLGDECAKRSKILHIASVELANDIAGLQACLFCGGSRDYSAHSYTSRIRVDSATLRRSRRRSEARPHLEQGMELAHRCRATVLAEHAREELIVLGARPRRFVATGVDSLTASERRVAEMAASGMTNREIAQALFVTQKTVEFHLSHTYQKLDIDSRRELSRALSGEMAAPE